MQTDRSVTAVLGPTNTGKTHLAIERMLGHESGMIGLPLRLLAREVYNKVVAKAGDDKVALITGEEKIVPPEARYWVCTVEAMPSDIDVDFLAVDEVQLAHDLERGHVFTNRILTRRGSTETLLLGAATMQPLIESLLPNANIVTRPRMSVLSYAGEKKITRLPRRSAVVAFSSNEVYAIAELIRRQRGGAAVVLGALSPRTRNAQVAIYQEGDVDFLVATDAIGMGLNLDVDHVAFANDHKFDGFQHRRLTPSEFGQIAGRAGRFTRDGTFGVTGQAQPLETDLIERLESHVFEPLQVIQWRSDVLDFSSTEALKASLDEAPKIKGLTRAPICEDRQALEYALNHEETREKANTARDVELLWSVCALPDYRNIAPATHAELVSTIFCHVHDGGAIPEDWFSQQIGFADRDDGDIDTLSNRIAHVRTWQFVANRPDWLKDPNYWVGVTRQVEDKLSDALHERLTQRFVDRRTSVLMKRLQGDEQLEAHIEEDGSVHVESHILGKIEGLSFIAEKTGEATHNKAIQAAAQRVLADEMRDRGEALSIARAGALSLTRDGDILWKGAPVAKLAKSDDILKPRMKLVAHESLTGAAKERAEARLNAWLSTETETRIKPLVDLKTSDGFEGISRGVAYRIVEGLGVLPRADAAEEIQQIDQETRAKFRALGVRFGAYHVFVPALLKPGPRALLAQLYALKTDTSPEGLNKILALSASGRTSVPLADDLAPELYQAVGYRVCGKVAVRIDILERLADIIRPLIAWRGDDESERPEGAEKGAAFRTTVGMTSLVGCAGEDFASILTSLGYKRERREEPAPVKQKRAQIDATAPTQPEETASEAPPSSQIGASVPGETTPASAASEPTETAGEETPAPESAPPSDGALPADITDAAGEDHPAAVPDADASAEAEASPVTASETVITEVSEPAADETVKASPPIDDAGAEEMADAQTSAPAEQGSSEAATEPTEPEMITVDIWRLRPPKRNQNRNRQGQRNQHSGKSQAAQNTPEGSQQQTTSRDTQTGDGPAQKRPPRHTKGPQGRPDQHGESDRQGKRDKHRGKGAGQKQGQSRPQKVADKPLDPSSPFAALQALKEQMEKEKG